MKGAHRDGEGAGERAGERVGDGRRIRVGILKIIKKIAIGANKGWH